jgi:hypothetical protein
MIVWMKENPISPSRHLCKMTTTAMEIAILSLETSSMRTTTTTATACLYVYIRVKETTRLTSNIDDINFDVYY